MRKRWQQPAAYWFLLIVTLFLMAVVHILFVALIFRHPQPVITPKFSDMSKKLDLELILQKEREEAKRRQQVLDTKRRKGIGAGGIGSDLDPNNVSRDTNDSPTAGSNNDGTSSGSSDQGDGKAKVSSEEAMALPEKLKALVAWVKMKLGEEEENFRYSPWFMAPIIISFVLLVFFFIRELYLIDSVRQCMGAHNCPEWTKLNSAVVPIVSAAFHAIVTSNSAADFIKELSRAVIDTPARDVLLSLRSSYNEGTLQNNIVKANFYDYLQQNGIPTNLLLLNRDEIQYNVTAKKKYVFRVYDHVEDFAYPPVLLTSSPSKPVGRERISAYVTNNTVYVALLKEDGQFYPWSDWFFDYSYDFYDVLPYMLACNTTEVGNYIATVANQTYAEYVDKDLMDSVAGYIGMTGQEFAQQLIIAMVKPSLEEMCNTTEVLPSTTPLNQVVSDVLSSVVTGATNTTDKAKKSLTQQAAEQRKRLDKLSKKSLQFYRSLKNAFCPGFFIGASVALFVATASMVVILAVYKRAVIKLRKQLAVVHIIKTHPDGELLLQGTSFGQKQFIDKELGLEEEESGSGSVDPASQVFQMLELLKVTRLPMVIFFYGVVFSTVLLQLVVCTVLFGLALTLLFHPMFWQHAFPFLASIVVALVFSQLLVLVVISGAIGSRIAPGGKIKSMSAWLAYFITFSFAYIILGVLLAVVRLVFIFLSALVMSCRIDICLNQLHRALDPAYNGFLSMMKMQVEMKNYADRERWGKFGDDDEDAAPWRTQVTVAKDSDAKE